MKGYVQVYTGDGKGKTTASLGLTLRAVGAGLKVYIIQFLKKGDYSEIKALEKFFGQVTIEQFGLGKFVKGKPSLDDVVAGKKGYDTVTDVLQKGEHDVVIVEEGNVAVSCGLITEEMLLKLIDIKQEHVELIITGRNATDKLIEKADLVTEMREIKHYYKKGVQARIGIEK